MILQMRSAARSLSGSLISCVDEYFPRADVVSQWAAPVGGGRRPDRARKSRAHHQKNKLSSNLALAEQTEQAPPRKAPEILLTKPTALNVYFGRLFRASAKVAVMVTSIEGIVAVVVGHERICKDLSITCPASKLLFGWQHNSGHCDNGARSMLSAPAAAVHRQGKRPGWASVRAFWPLDESCWVAPGTGVLSKTESEDADMFTRVRCNSMSCEEEPTRIL